MTPMCAVACWNVAVQEDKALLGHISPCVPWKHVEAGVAFCVFDFEDSCSRMAPINQANDGHQGKVPTHCQVSLWRRQIDQVWSWRHLVSNCFLCPRLLLLLQCLRVSLSARPCLGIPPMYFEEKRHYSIIASSWSRSMKARGEECLKFKLKAIVQASNPSWAVQVI